MSTEANGFRVGEAEENTLAEGELAVTEGHEWIYRLTAMGGDRALETRYFKEPYETRGWRDRLRETGYEAVVAAVPASAFRELSDTELDELAERARQEESAPVRQAGWSAHLREQVLTEGGTWTGNRAMEYLHSIGFECTLERARQCMENVAGWEPERVGVVEAKRWVWEAS